ncbi:MAG: AAA family ATPase [Bacteroidota bacterium]|nr:AAA family ATPase [Bacteroidota bacterium]MDP4214178.1 AAA family ATPase [Bacteroidota bacterium]
MSRACYAHNASIIKKIITLIMGNIEQQKVVNMNNVFDDHFLDVNTLYLFHFNELPSLHFRKYIDGEKAFEAFKLKFRDRIVKTHQYRWFSKSKRKFQFDQTVLILDNHCIVEFDDNYCEVLHNNEQPEFLQEIDELVSRFKEKQRREPLEMNLIVRTSSGFGLTSMEIKRTKLDLDLFYQDDFRETDELIRKRLRQKKDKGIVLLHGLPGTGKTTYLRYLIGRIKKRILFVPSDVASDILNPDFIKLMIDNPNTVLIIEDAENIIMDRKIKAGSSVSNLLNISDGLLSDCLNVQLICTFNSPLTMVDGALLRKGRLIAKYEFGKLSVTKSQKLSNHLGFHTTIKKPMAIAEIAGQHEKTEKTETIEIIGFRRHHLEN